jgi:ribulose-5-phosphate 4-epimerase/fuculose-1-phosphate aldolase
MHKVQKKYKQNIKELVQTTVRLGEIGYVTSHGGNLSCRVDEDTVLITPTKVQKKMYVLMI